MSGRRAKPPIAQVVLVEIEPSAPGEPCRSLQGAYVVAVTARTVTIEYDAGYPRVRPWRVTVDRVTGRPPADGNHAFRVADADLPRLANLTPEPRP